VVTKDADFARKSAADRRSQKLILLSIGNTSTDEVAQLLRKNAIRIQYQSEQQAENCWFSERPDRM